MSEQLIPTDNGILGQLVEISQLAKDYAKNARSKNTEKSYRSDWHDFQRWCQEKALTHLPADPFTIAGYLADRAAHAFKDPQGKLQKPLKASSLARRLSAIRQAHRLAGHDLDSQHPAIQETWKGIKNTHGVAQIRKEPILIEDLREMVQAIQIEKKGKPFLQGLRDRALLLLGFAGAFRRSELVSLQCEDLKLIRDGYVVTLRRSKIDQIGEGREIAIPYGSNSRTCPVRALQDWIQAAELSAGALFRPINRHGQMRPQAMSAHAVALVVKRNGHLAEKAHAFSGHSLRAGFATTAAIAGVPEYAIMKQTGHKRSDTLKNYIRSRDLWKDNAASKVGL